MVMIKWQKTCVDASNDNSVIKTSDQDVNRRWSQTVGGGGRKQAAW